MEKSRVRSFKTSPSLTTLVAGSVSQAVDGFCQRYLLQELDASSAALLDSPDRSPLASSLHGPARLNSPWNPRRYPRCSELFLLRRLRLPIPLTAARFFFFFLLAPFCVCVGSPQGLGYLREPATTPAGWGLFAGCPRATHPTAPLGRQMGRWAPRWAARGASRRAPGALRTRPGLSSAGSRPGERPRRTTAPAGEPVPVRAVARTSGCCG